MSLLAIKRAIKPLDHVRLACLVVGLAGLAACSDASGPQPYYGVWETDQQRWFADDQEWRMDGLTVTFQTTIRADGTLLMEGSGRTQEATIEPINARRLRITFHEATGPIDCTFEGEGNQAIIECLGSNRPNQESSFRWIMNRIYN